MNIWPLILLSFAFDQGKNMQITKFWQLFLRGGLLSLSYTAYYLALAGLDFAQATSLYFTAPLFITFLSWVTTRVPIGWRRLTGVIIGLVGVVFIVKPGVGDIPLLPALMAVASAFFYALSALMTNWLGRTESTTVQSVTFVIMNLIIGALFWAIFGEGWAVDHAPEGLEVLLKAWVWPTRTDVLIMVGIGLGSAIGFIMLTAAYRNLEPSFAALFEYCLLGYNLLWGLLLFRQVPRCPDAGRYCHHRQFGPVCALPRGRAASVAGAAPVPPSAGQISPGGAWQAWLLWPIANRRSLVPSGLPPVVARGQCRVS